MTSDLSERLQSMYRRFNKRCYIHTDPLEMLYNYPEVGDREVAGFISSALAYGNVRQILNSIGTVLDTMGSLPRRYHLECMHTDFQHDLDGFVHRFATGRHLAAMLAGIKGVLETYGTLQDGFAAGVEKRTPITFQPWVDLQGQSVQIAVKLIRVT